MPAGWLALLTRALIFAIAALSLDLILGVGGGEVVADEEVAPPEADVGPRAGVVGPPAGRVGPVSE